MANKIIKDERTGYDLNLLHCDECNEDLFRHGDHKSNCVSGKTLYCDSCGDSEKSRVWCEEHIRSYCVDCEPEWHRNKRLAKK